MTARAAAKAFTALCAAVCAAVLALPVSNPDLWWHLSAGRWIAANRALPRVDWLSWTMEGRPWTDFEWLWQALCWLAFRAGGHWLLWGLKCAGLAAAAALSARALALYGAGPAGRALGAVAWVLGTVFFNDLRPEMFSVLAFLVLWLRLERRRLERRVRVPAAEAAAALALFAAWGNVHGGFPYGLALLGLFAAGEAWRLRSWGLFSLLAACAAAPLLNPYGARVYSMLFEHAASRADLQEFIREWAESTLMDPALWPFWALLAVSFAAVLARQLRHKDVPFEHLCALLASGLAASWHVRTGVYFACVAVPVAGAALIRLRPPRAGAMRWGAAAAAAAYAAFILARVPPVPFNGPHLYGNVPPAAADFLEREKAALSDLRMLNAWQWGGYLGWRLHPDYRVYVDGRYIFHPLLRPMQEAAADPEKYRRFLDERGIGLAVVKPAMQAVTTYARASSGPPIMMVRPYYLFLFPRADWALVYWDDAALVFARRRAVDRRWLEENEFVLLRPGDAYAAELRAVRGLDGGLRRLASEVERYARAAPTERAEEVRAWLAAVRGAR